MTPSLPPDADHPLQITYQMTRWDYAAMTRAITRRSWQRSVMMMGLWLLAIWALLASTSEQYNPVTLVQLLIASGAIGSVAVMLAVALVLSFAGHWLAWAISFLYYRQIAAADTTVTMTLGAAGIEAGSTIAQSTLPWASIKRVIIGRDHLFLPISRREALILPKRGFASPEQFTEAAHYIRERLATVSG